MFDYSNCYATLGATPETDRKALRTSYKRLIGQWHPDRFSDDPALGKLAEERSKQITTAYQALEKYRRHHGVLPPIERAPGPEETGEPAQKAVPEDELPRFETRAEGRRTRASARELARRGQGPQRAVIACSALIVALFLADRYLDLSAPDDDPPRVALPAPSVETPVPQPPVQGISTGSTLGEVYSIQGIPTVTEGETWHYGKSQIRFAQGKVTSWKEHPDNPLRIAGSPFVRSPERHFNIGSTKDEVRAIQGTPVSETESVWDYAPSRVYFERNRVVRWQESPMQPLRVPR